MLNIEKLRTDRKEAFDKMSQMLELADSESRDLTDEETTEYDNLERSYDKFGKDIDRVEKQIVRDEELRKPVRTIMPENTVIEPVRPEEFKDMGEFIYSVRFNRNDNRLGEYVRFPAPPEYRAEQSMGEGTAGGFMVPNQFKPGLLEIDPQGEFFRPWLPK